MMVKKAEKGKEATEKEKKNEKKKKEKKDEYQIGLHNVLFFYNVFGLPRKGNIS